MDKESQERLNIISAKEMFELTEDDKNFLFGRRSYLGPRGQKKFGALIKEMEEARGVGKIEKKKEVVKKAPKAPAKKEPEVKKAPENGTGPENPFDPVQDEDDEDEDSEIAPDGSDDEDEDEDDKALG